MSTNNILDYPADRDNELLLIANLMRDVDNRFYFSRQGKYKHFRFKEFQTISWAIVEAVNEELEINIDMILLKSKSCPVKYTVEFSFLKTILDNPELPTINLDNFKAHMEKLSLDFVKSQLVDKIFSSLHSVASSPTSTLPQIEERLDYLKGILKDGYSANSLEFKGMDVIIPEYIHERESHKERYSTGFSQLDAYLTEGFAPKQITIVSALSSMGKSSLCLSMMKNLANMGIYTAQFALEMNNISLTHKLLSFNTRLPLSTILGPFSDLTDDEKKLYTWELSRLQSNKYLYLDDKPTQKLTNIREQIMLLQDHLKTEYMVVVIDLFGKISELQSSDNFARDYEKHANTVQRITKELGVHMILVSQIRKDVAQRRFSRPTMNDLKNAGALTEISDIILGVHRPYYNPELALKTKISESITDQGNLFQSQSDDTIHNAIEDMDRNVAEVIIMKQRMGENNVLVNFFFDPNTTCFFPCTAADSLRLNNNKTDLLGE